MMCLRTKLLFVDTILCMELFFLWRIVIISTTCQGWLSEWAYMIASQNHLSPWISSNSLDFVLEILLFKGEVVRFSFFINIFISWVALNKRMNIELIMLREFILIFKLEKWITEFVEYHHRWRTSRIASFYIKAQSKSMILDTSQIVNIFKPPKSSIRIECGSVTYDWTRIQMIR